MPIPPKHRRLLAQSRWFHGSPAAFRDQVLAIATVREFEDGARIFARGDAPDGLYAVLDGHVHVSGVGEGGRGALLAVLAAPTWFGEISVFDGKPRTHDATACGAVKLLHVEEQALQNLLLAEPTFWRVLGILMASQLRLAFQVTEDLAVSSPRRRLARRLVMLARGYGDLELQSRRVVTIKQEELAMMLSLSRQTANQLLKELEARGLVKLAYGGIEILDLALLEAEAMG